jgi:hypothetical protein
MAQPAVATPVAIATIPSVAIFQVAAMTTVALRAKTAAVLAATTRLPKDVASSIMYQQNTLKQPSVA